jgi:hypothetical protein
VLSVLPSPIGALTAAEFAAAKQHALANPPPRAPPPPASPIHVGEFALEQVSLRVNANLTRQALRIQVRSGARQGVGNITQQPRRRD